MTYYYLFRIAIIYIITVTSTVLASLSKNQYSIQKQLTYFSCDVSIPTKLFYGSEIFQNIDYSSTQLSSISLSGWFFLRGYNNTYTLFSIEESQQLLFSIGYDVNKQQILSKLFQTQQIINIPNFQKNYWYFFSTTIKYKTLTITLTTTILENKGIVYQQSSPQESSFRLTKFTKNNIIINIGNSVLKDDIYQSCSFSRNMYIYFDEDLVFNNSYINDISQLDTKLIWHFDFFYTKINTGFIVNINNPMNQLQIQINRSQQQEFDIKPKEYFLTDYINVIEQRGFTVTFHFKVQQTAQSSLRLLEIVDISDKLIIEIVGDKVQMNNKFIQNIGFNQWIQITLIIQFKNKLQVYLIVKGYEQFAINLEIGIFLFCQLKFGSENNQDQIYINHLRIYQGTFVTSLNSNNCWLQSSIQDKSCLICDSGKLINYQGQVYCHDVSIENQSTLVTDVRDYKPSRKDCEPDMIRDQVTNNCVCRFQYYKENNICKMCPTYCKGCIDQKTCIQKDSNRDIYGKCPNRYFDDGYKCLSNQFQISSKVNFIKQLADLDLSQNCSPSLTADKYNINNSDLKLTGKDSFFVSFTFKSHLPRYQRGGIWNYKDGNRELFTVMYNRTQNAIVEFFVDGKCKHFFLVNDNEAVWIALWTDLNDAIFMVHTNAQILFKQVELNLATPYTYNDPQISIGPVKTLYDDNHCCGNFMLRPLIFIYSMSNPMSDIQQIQNLIPIPFKSQNLAYFNIDINQSYNLNNIQDTSSGKILDFQSSPLVVSKQYGIQFTDLTYAQIKGLNFYEVWPSFSCYLFIEKLQYQTSVLQYETGFANQKVEYFVVPFGTLAFVRICFYTQCQDSQYSMIQLNKLNYLLIIVRLRSPFSNDITYLEFEIICNQQREQIKFIQEPIVLSQTSNDILLGKQTHNSGNFSIYLNKINLDQGDGSYYFEYNQDDNCFIYKNIQDMKCIQPKQGYVFYEKFIISEQDCLNLTESKKKIHVIYTNECIETKFDLKCAEVDQSGSEVKCKKCALDYADLNNDCLCLDGRYADYKYKSCLPCSQKCLTCENNRDNCILCKNQNQIAPSCFCIQSNQFLDENYLCQECSPKCQSCEFNKDNCINCSLNRQNPPQCDCESLSYIDKYHYCEILTCHQKCETCAINSSNCLKCKQGRFDPPFCLCDDNYYEISDGTCVPCPNGTYYDNQIRSCLPCQKPCKECSKRNNQCTFCEEDFTLKQDKCFCSNGSSPSYTQNNSYLCLEDMDVNLNIILKNQFYYLEFSFDYSIQQINFKSQELLNYLEIHLNEIPKEFYYLSEPSIKNNKLQIKLTVQTSFSTKSGTVRFLMNSPFISISERYVLSQKYIYQPIDFEIGPFIFSDDIMSLQNFNQVIDKLKNENSDLLYIIQSSQLLFYFLNTAQPTMLFFLIDAQFPPNLYSFYQMFGVLIYPDVIDYQSKDFKQNFKLFNYNLSSKEVDINQNFIYKRLGFSNSFLINTLSTILKYFLIFFLIIILNFIRNLKNIKKNTQHKVIRYSQILLQKINSENETNLLIITISILIQQMDSQDDIWAVRYGHYFSYFYLIIFIFSVYKNIVEINNKRQVNKQMYSYQYTSRQLNTSNIFSKNYFIIQMMKKYIVIIILFAFRGLPYYACILNGIIFFISGISTIIAKPYKTLLSRGIKICGDFMLSITWFLHILILNIENQFYNQTQLNQDSIKQYLKIGMAIMVILFIFNLIYLLEYVQMLFFFIEKRYILQKQKKQKPQYLPILKTKSTSHIISSSPLFQLSKKTKSYEKQQTQL